MKMEASWFSSFSSSAPPPTARRYLLSSQAPLALSVARLAHSAGSWFLLRCVAASRTVLCQHHSGFVTLSPRSARCFGPVGFVSELIYYDPIISALPAPSPLLYPCSLLVRAFELPGLPLHSRTARPRLYCAVRCKPL